MCDVPGIVRADTWLTAQQQVDAIRWVLSHKPHPTIFMAAATLIVCRQEIRSLQNKERVG